MKEVIHIATSVIYSSPVAQELVEKVFPEFSDRAELCPIIEATATGIKPRVLHEKIAILFIGATGPHKGILDFEKLVLYFGARFRFITVGVEDYFRGTHEVNHRHYNFTEGHSIKHILQGEFPAFAFLGSITPETFSFTAHECLEAGIPILTTAHSGNVCRLVLLHQLGLEFESLSALASYLESQSDAALKLFLQRSSSEHRLDLNRGAIARVYLEVPSKMRPVANLMKLVPLTVPAQVQ